MSNWKPYIRPTSETPPRYWVIVGNWAFPALRLGPYVAIADARKIKRAIEKGEVTWKELLV